MSWPFLLMQVVLLLWLSPSFLGVAATAVQLGNETDQLALLALKAKIRDDPLGFMSLWNESVHFCQWPGVTCGHRHQRVVRLDLFSHNLGGSISPHVGNLSFLRQMRLSNNSFSDKIPREFGRLRRLQVLVMVDNLISGEIPSNLSGCSNLFALDVSNNILSGNIPIEFGSLSNLEGIYINQNNLTGVIPSSLGNLSSLRDLSARSNNIGGYIPDAIGRLQNLTFFAFGANDLSGTIPLTIFNLTSLTTFDVSSNHIQGSLPSYLGDTLPNLEFLGIGINQFSGTIPASLSNSSQLKIFAAAVDNLFGKVPNLEKLHKLELLVIGNNYLGSGEVDGLGFVTSLTNATNLRVLVVDYNRFEGVLPESIGNLSTKLETLTLRGNQLLGTIPDGITNMVNLQRMQLGNNQFTGTIPSDIGRLHKLKRVDLSETKLSGNIPPSIGNLSEINELNLGRNNLQGNIPLDLGKCQNLLMLDLAQNNLSGPIPHQVFGLSSLSLYLDLSQNQLTGSLPTEIGNLRNLGILYVFDNMLFGEIPSSLGSCISLEGLYTNRNHFQGTIPSSLSALTGLQYLDLSQNNFSGQIPEYLGRFSLKYLNVSFNNFEGMVPTKGVFENATATSVLGNSKLCGGVPELKLPKCNWIGVKKRQRFYQNLKFIIPTTLGLLGLIMILCVLLLRLLRRRRKKPSSSLLEYSLLRVSYQDLLKATNGFSSANSIGIGGFGIVYKGTLDDEKIVAVKVLNVQQRGASRSFIAECEALRNIRHRNLVRLLTACSGVDYNGNDFKALVYEFMVNGSLEGWLHPIQHKDEVKAESPCLDLDQRLKISIDVATALDYLHNECQTPIVHCDLKPSNVLLDNEMTGHVGDFGMAKLLIQVTGTPPENQTSSIGIKGTIGYAPPEYGMGSEVSTNGDVYSYGILLLEMFTGKRPTDNMFNESLNLHNYSKMAFPERVAAITDSAIFQQVEVRETSTSTSTNSTTTQNQIGNTSQKVKECLIWVFRIGITCSEEDPRQRMDIRDVAVQLRVIRDTFLRAGGVL